MAEEKGTRAEEKVSIFVKFFNLKTLFHRWGASEKSLDRSMRQLNLWKTGGRIQQKGWIASKKELELWIKGRINHTRVNGDKPGIQIWNYVVGGPQDFSDSDSPEAKLSFFYLAWLLLRLGLSIRLVNLKEWLKSRYITFLLRISAAEVRAENAERDATRLQRKRDTVQCELLQEKQRGKRMEEDMHKTRCV